MAVIAWGTDPTFGMSAEARAVWRRLGAKFITVKPEVQMAHQDDRREGVITIGDVGNRLASQLHACQWIVHGLRSDVSRLSVAALPVPGDLAQHDCPAGWPEQLDYLMETKAVWITLP